ncbi:MAG: hypothetical protein H8E46_00580, partial [FCB group bacterium]|nr:hypothetical protein [FCB group bacterium]
MLRTTKLSLTFLLLIWLAPAILFAQPMNISGNQSGILGPGIYNVVGDISVPSGQTLTIMPGTEFRHTGHFYWYIYGEIQAVGNPDGVIEFVREQPIENHKWGGLRFQTGASDESVIEYCKIEYCKNVSYPNYYGGGFYSNGVDAGLSPNRVFGSLATIGGGGSGSNRAAGAMSQCVITQEHARNCGRGVFSKCFQQQRQKFP